MICVLYLLSTLKRSGPINQTFNIIKGLDKQSFEVVVVTLSREDNDSLLQEYVDYGIRVHCLKKKRTSVLGCIIPLLHFLKSSSSNIDIIHSQSMRCDVVALFIKLLTRIPICSTTRSDPLNPDLSRFNSLSAKINTFIQFRAFRHFNKLFVPSQHLRDTVLKHYSLDSCVIENGVDTDTYYPIYDVKQIYAIKRELHIPDDVIIITVLGMLNPNKNNEMIVNTLNKCIRKDLFVQFLGDGCQKEMLERQNKQDKVVFRGFISAPSKFLQVSDIIISASFTEGLPNSILEAVSCGVFPILSSIGPHLDIISYIHHGLIFDPNDDNAFFSIIDSLDIDIIHSAKKDIAQNAALRYGRMRMSKQYQEEYSNILN